MTSALTIAIVVDVSVAVALALLVCRVLRRRPAALRHWCLATSLALAAGAPLLEIMLPSLELPVLPGAAQVTNSGPAFSSELTPAAVPDDSQVQETPRLRWVQTLVAVWALGFGALLASLLAGLARLTWMTRRCRPVQSQVWRERAAALSTQYGLRRRVEVVESQDRALLVTWGLMRPRIIVPAAATSWSAERIDVVLAHELAHIVRCDWAVQVAAEILRAVHWFNPLLWIACRRLRAESEQACDDTVLRRGVDAAEYASHLLAVARHVLTAGGGWASAPAVAHASTLERRVAAMLNVSCNREPVTRAARLLALLVTVALTVPVAAATLTERIEVTPFVRGSDRDIVLAEATPMPETPVVATPVTKRVVPRLAAPTPALPAAAQQRPASLSGTLRDSQGGVLPGVEVTLTNAAGMSVSRVTEPNGAFVIRDLVPGQYQFVARLPGFRTVTEMLNLADGQDVRRDLILTIGQLTESLMVTCPATTVLLRGETLPVLSLSRRATSTRLFPSLREVQVAQSALAAQVLPLRVGGQIMAPRQIKRVAPVCPTVTPGAGLVVVLDATVGVDGLIKDLAVLRPRPADAKQTGYVQAAVDAVRQWEYTPTRLNGVPTPVIVTVTVTFVVSPSPN